MEKYTSENLSVDLRVLSSILSGSSCKSDIKGMESVMESILGLREKERFILPGFWVCPSSLLFFFYS